MIQESLLDKILYRIKKLIPKPVFEFFQPAYHRTLARAGALRHGFPSHKLKVIGVTGTKGKSTTVFMITKILEGAGKKVAAIGSLGFQIGDRRWPNTLKMTMPGRFRLQKFLAEAVRAQCEYVVLEVTSEGIKQMRHLGIRFDTAVFVNIHREHLENHGSFENYLAAKQELFQACGRNHVLNVEDPYAGEFAKIPAEKKITFGLKDGDVKCDSYETSPDRSEFTVAGIKMSMRLGGREFNIANALAAIAVGSLYGVSIADAARALEEIDFIPGRMQFIQKSPFAVVVDYAHTPDSLRAVYAALKPAATGRLIAVLGAAGGGRDKWKRPEFGKIADELADEIILTDEDPYEENPESIIEQIKQGIGRTERLHVIMDRKEAIGAAVALATAGDVVVITGKGSEVSMAVAGNRKIPWSDAEIVKAFLQ
ncbi:MAG TPA: UDP-N-acetylmuramoyl-L-alanyl-D-glutamate--2,6-diaminopimelate ligase [Candidatus Paceibacterota bacterium]|nr:UDP-N-acetylmuramoyl-L-alanyl-D-glutamate--2,6-diaminopimelate ligase [Candidatus Paceibacterota bacterium]